MFVTIPYCLNLANVQRIMYCFIFLVYDHVKLQLFNDLKAPCPTMSNVNRVGFPSPGAGGILGVVEHELRWETDNDHTAIGVELKELSLQVA